MVSYSVQIHRYGVKSYPTIKHFAKGELNKDYDRGRTKADVVGGADGSKEGRNMFYESLTPAFLRWPWPSPRLSL